MICVTVRGLFVVGTVSATIVGMIMFWIGVAGSVLSSVIR
jgi:hypothetical protein